MKKLIYSSIFFLTNLSFSQVIHNCKVLGMYSIGNSEITMFYDSDCYKKTSAHSQNLFVYDEWITVEIDSASRFSLINKPGLTEKVYLSNTCDEISVNDNLILNEAEKNGILPYLDLLQRGFAGLINSLEIKTTIAEFLENENKHEKIYLNELELKLQLKNIDLFNLIKNSLIRQGISLSQINDLSGKYKRLISEGKTFDVFIHVPDSENFRNKSQTLVSKTLRTDYIENHYGYFLRTNSQIEITELEENTIDDFAIITLSVSLSENHDIYPSLFFEKCHCTRSTKLPEGQISTQGKCVKNGSCNGVCDRGGLFSGCSGAQCSGC